MVTVAAGDEVALYRAHRTVRAGRRAAGPEGHSRPGARELVQRHVVDLIEGLPARRRPGRHQVARDLGLAVNANAAADQRSKVHPMTGPAEGELDPLVHETFAAHPLARARGIEQLSRALLDDSGTDAAEDVLGTAPLEQDVRDPLLREQLPEQKPGGTGADDRDLGAHGLLECGAPDGTASARGAHRSALDLELAEGDAELPAATLRLEREGHLSFREHLALGGFDRPSVGLGPRVV